jgi:hypothetical protein
MSRDTTTGKDYEDVVRAVIERSCRKNNLTARTQVEVSDRPEGGKHRIDWELTSASDENVRILVSCKVQNSSGTAEEKVVYEVVKLIHTMDSDPRYKHAYIVLGGTGWRAGLKDFVAKDLKNYIPSMDGRVTVVTTTDALVALNISADGL